MNVRDIISTIDDEIARLKQVRAILSAETKSLGPKATAKPKALKRKRTLSPEARKRIADAQRKRWAAQKNSAKNK